MKVEIKIPKGWRRLKVGEKVRFGKDQHTAAPGGEEWHVTLDGPSQVEDDFFTCIRKK